MFRTWMLDNSFVSWCRVWAALPSPCHLGLRWTTTFTRVAHFKVPLREIFLCLGQDMGRWKELGGPRRRLVGCMADVANTAKTWPMGKEPRRGDRDEKIPQTTSAGSAARNLSSTSWFASNSSDRSRHVPKYFSISSINRPAVFKKKKSLLLSS